MTAHRACRCMVALVVLALAADAGAARAQSLPEDVGPRDWAGSLPSCVMGESALQTGPLLVLYPRPGLPAVVHAGASLFARIRVPSALTPPPGHQQDKALRGFGAELVASDGTSVSGALSRYVLRVADVRPDTGASLVYRLRLPVPDWVAPGTYSLRVRAPSSGERVSVASVRVLASGAVPRLVALSPSPGLPVDELRRRLGALQGYPADVLVATTTPTLEVALNSTQVDARWPPVLLTGTPRAAGMLRVGGTLLELGACPTGAYAHQRRALLGLGHVTEAPALSTRVTRDEALVAWWTTAGAESVLRTSQRDSALVVSAARWLPRPAEARILVPEDDLATRIAGADVESWWPGTDLYATAESPSLVADVRVPAGAEATITRQHAAPLRLQLSASPARPTTEQDVRLHAEVSSPAQIAWRLGEDVTALGPGAQHRWALRGRVEVHALAIGPDGVAGRAALALTVDTQRTELCAASTGGGGRSGSLLGGISACILAVLWTFRGRQHRMRRARE